MKYKTFYDEYNASKEKANWAKLKATLELRRILQHSLTPAEDIGKNATKRLRESNADFKSRINDARKEHSSQARALWQAQGLKSRQQVQKMIDDLQKQESKLWVVCRPDLYELGEDGTLLDKF